MNRRDLLTGLASLPLLGFLKPKAEAEEVKFICTPNPPNDCPVLPGDTRVTMIEVPDVLMQRRILAGNLAKLESTRGTYARALKESGLNPKELAAILGKSYTWIMDQLSLTNLERAYQDEVDSCNISIVNAYRLSQIKMEHQKFFVKEARSMPYGDFYKHTSKYLRINREYNILEVDAFRYKSALKHRYKLPNGYQECFYKVKDSKEFDYHQHVVGIGKNGVFMQLYGSQDDLT